MRVVHLLTALAVLAAACGTRADGDAEPLGVRRDAIVNGQPDTTHPAVVYLRSGLVNGGYFECGGTLIQKDPSTGVGWVLTAAHCVTDWKPVTAFLGDDPAALATRMFSVLDWVAAPYTGAPGDTARDLALVRILGVDAQTPVIPIAAAADGLTVGSPVVSVGFGRVTADGPDSSKPARRNIARNLSALGETFLRFTMADGGICSGDSGGPVLAGTPPNERVVGVHSFVDPDCKGTGTSMRVSAELAFIAQALATTAPASTTCRVCAGIAESGSNVCAKRRDACAGDPDCKALLACRAACTSQACADTCAAKNPGGVPYFLGFQACSCHDACATECANIAGCNAIPACGTPATDACATCGASACCAERAAATYDKIGYACLGNAAGGSCASNAAFQTYASCLARSCQTACPTAVSAPPADGGTADAAPVPAPELSPDNADSGCNAGRRPVSFPLAGLLAMLSLIVLRRRSRIPQ